MFGDVHVEDPARSDLHSDEYVQRPEIHCHAGQEIAGDYGFGVIADECGPSLAGAAARLTGIQVPPYRSGRDLDTELKFQLGGDAFFAPGRILAMHLAN